MTVKVKYWVGLERNKMYTDQCGYYDNGRIRTWLPYKPNDDQTALVHEITGAVLLGEEEDKLYVDWYSGPQVGRKLVTPDTSL